ncbi:hypothetical protein BAUCODRAFT_301324 [Baudoinia panamericana UAMH 10762]|uniref:Sensitive to high expression protein 9, mitochondrial n=1 Tax=Baudoinia panamericana (strain UAMH 10762) TaxID=717646 RepID=M2MZC5_BAUPA|nr:uncharacterized protein BAUCODRAFT_301324 [Baudoinia panamericana UAMH 10762]EMC91685.1 hypothetical protein BAUCODRAFT_301324 [Baudoinia panamericana UAMH 10762]
MMRIQAETLVRTAVQCSTQPTLWAGACRVPKSGLTSWTCPTCRVRAYTTRRTAALYHDRRQAFTTSVARYEPDREARAQPVSPTRTVSAAETHSKDTSSAQLPSHVANRRWQLSKDMTRLVDGILARASIAGQYINVHTGTDYSGIETLRKGIIAQEQTVRNCQRKVDVAKTEHHESFSQQAAAQKEIVSLLERKSSWSPSDLERYMSLVRSEHNNDQAVQAAKDSLDAAERELEDARSLLERLERKQYHEEQIWSDTIRRNSTWVTFGLMGVNIVLLLAQILIFEPYRRRKIVRDVKVALDEKTLHAPARPQAERQVDEVVEPAGTPIEVVEAAVEEAQRAGQPRNELLGEAEQSASTAAAVAAPTPEKQDAFAVLANDMKEVPLHSPRKTGVLENYGAAIRDLFSERLIQIKQVELTTVALQGAATGVAMMGLLFVLLRPR